MSVNYILGATNILNILSDIKSFEKWLKEKHGKTLDQEILIGYKYITEVALRTLLEQLTRDDQLQLQQDFTFFRAYFYGVHIDDLPYTCEKAILVKKYWNTARKIRAIKTKKRPNKILPKTKNTNPKSHHKTIHPVCYIQKYN